MRTAHVLNPSFSATCTKTQLLPTGWHAAEVVVSNQGKLLAYDILLYAED